MAVQTDIVGRIALNRNAVAYVRVSTKDQNEETQLQQLLAQGVLPRECFCDTAASGTILAGQRRGLWKLLDCLREILAGDPVKLLYVFEISRVGRSFFETLGVVRKLEEGVRGYYLFALAKKSWI